MLGLRLMIVRERYRFRLLQVGVDGSDPDVFGGGWCR
jgi:hypothetical protein